MADTNTQAKPQVQDKPSKHIAANIQANAFKVAELLKKDSLLVSEITDFSTRKETNDVSALVIADRIMSDIEDFQIIMGMPMPGSRFVDPKTKEVNNNPDYYEDENFSGGKREKVTGRYYWDLAVYLGPGKEVNENLHWVKDASNKDGASSDNPLAKLPSPELAALQDTFNKRKRNILNVMTDAAILAKHMVAANQIDGVEVEMRRDQKDPNRPVRGNANPIIVSDVSNGPNAKYNVKWMGVQQFLGLDPFKVTDEMIAKHKGAYEAFIATGMRERKTDGQKPGTLATGGSKYPPIKSDDNFIDWAQTGAHYFDVNDEVKPDQKQIAHILNLMADPKTGNDVIETIGDICMAFDNIWHHIDKRYNSIKQSKLDASKAA